MSYNINKKEKLFGQSTTQSNQIQKFMDFPKPTYLCNMWLFYQAQTGVSYMDWVLGLDKPNPDWSTYTPSQHAGILRIIQHISSSHKTDEISNVGKIKFGICSDDNVLLILCFSKSEIMNLYAK